jgi:hypothetical protein
MALRDWWTGRLTSPFGAGETAPMLPPPLPARHLLPARERIAVHAVSPGRASRIRNPKRRPFSPETTREIALRPR